VIKSQTGSLKIPARERATVNEYFVQGREAQRIRNENLMSYIKQMFESHPVNPSSDHATNIECITACYSCAEACNACADACLGEQNVSEMVRCIRDCTDCADVCLVTARIVSRFTRTDFKLAGAQLRACIQACQSCGAQCEQHGAKMEHCRVCAEACRRCEKACEALLAE